MINSFSDWLCNLFLWAAIVTLAALLYQTFVSQGLLNNAVFDFVALGVIVVLSFFWPKY